MSPRAVPGRRASVVRTVALAVGVLLAVAACSSSASPEGRAPIPEAIGTLRSGDPLPEATFAVLGGDEQVSTSEFRGTPTIVNFWATWCAFCVDEMPDLERAHQRLGDAVRFVGIDRQDNTEKALELARETGVTYLLLESPGGEYFTQVKGRGMPTTLFVDADGVIQHRHVGPITTEQLLDLVEEKLGVTA